MKRLPSWAWAGMFVLLAIGLNAMLSPGFLEVTIRDGRLYGSVIDILNRAAPVAILSLGMTLVIATGGVDLSVGAVMAISGATAAGLIARPQGTPFQGGQSSPALAVPLALVAGLCAGGFNALLVAVFGFQPIVATLLLMVAGRGVAQLLANGQIVTFQEPGFAQIGRGATWGLPQPIWLMLAALLALGALTRTTAFGLLLEATGSNSTAAQYVGINARAIKATVYVVSGLCAALAGLIVTADIQAADANNAGLYLELDAILAVAVGGTALTGGRFSLVGSIIGALLMQTLTTTILTHGVSPEITLVLKALVVVAVCLLQSPELRNRLARPQGQRA